MNLAIPKLRPGSYFPAWLLERSKHAERALTRGRHLLAARSVGPADGQLDLEQQWWAAATGKEDAIRAPTLTPVR